MGEILTVNKSPNQIFSEQSRSVKLMFIRLSHDRVRSIRLSIVRTSIDRDVPTAIFRLATSSKVDMVWCYKCVLARFYWLI